MLNDSNLKKIIKNALKEDIGKKDITTELIIPKDKIIKAVLLAKQDLVVCGLKVAGLTFKILDRNIKFKPLVSDGNWIKKGKVLAKIKGKAVSILTAERTALNFLTHLSGIATLTRRFVEAARPYKVKIMDTRKTLPGLRALEKYAVRIGGGFNHRFSLDQMILIKDNHLASLDKYPSLQKIQDALKLARARKPKKIKLEIEVKNLRQFNLALKEKPDIIMLDNIGIKKIKQAVAIRNRIQRCLYSLKPKLEASGKINLKNIKKIASTGVDMISIGALTHSAPSVDISLEVL
ncbi:MAG: carboxylating nicotinate-nucleotide diphosphorylase [Candidatus Omnitrophica bacterium]|nr:carboxylating nicotinate-nucleotide diphosphorylase [Candidatus Omnitrophota bacterium]